MSNPMIPDSSEVKESGQAIQGAQNTAIATGSAATLTVLCELIRILKLSKKIVNVAININDSLAYKANLSRDKFFIEADSPNLSKEQMNYLKEVVKLPVTNQPPSSQSIPLDKDLTITVNNKEVFSLKNGIIEKNLLIGEVDLSKENSVNPVQEKPIPPFQENQQQNIVNPVQQSQQNSTLSVPSLENLQTPVSSHQEKSIPVQQSQETTTPLSKVEVVETPEIVFLSSEQKQALKQAGLDGETILQVEKAINQNQSNSAPVGNNNSKGTEKNGVQNLDSKDTGAKKGVFDRLRDFVGISSEEEYDVQEGEPVEKEVVEDCGVDSEITVQVEKVIDKNQSNSVPLIIFVNQAVDKSKSKGHTKNNFQGLVSKIQNAVKDLTRKVTSLLASTRERFFPATDKNLKQDLQNLAVVQVASRLLDHLGSKPNQDGSQVFEGNSFRIERSENNFTLTAKDGRGTILSSLDGVLTGSLTDQDVNKFKALQAQLNQSQSLTKSKQSQAEMG